MIKIQHRKGKKKTTLNLMIWIKEKQTFKSGKTKSGKWSIEPLGLFLFPGKQYDEQNKQTLQLAEAIRAKRQIEVFHEGYGEIPEHKKRGDFVSFVENMAKERDRNWKFAAKVLRNYFPNPLSFKALDEEKLEEFQSYLKKKYTNNMAWLLEVKIRAAIREAGKKKLLSIKFLAKVPSISYVRPQHTFFTEEEIERLNNTPLPENPDVRRAALFSIFTGLRWSDYSELTWRNVQGDDLCFKQKKIKGEATQIPLNASAKQILNEQKIIDPGKKIFTLPGYMRVLQVLEIWRRRAGIQKKFTTHCGRHTYGHLLARSGFDTYRIQQALGQRTMDAAITYSHLVKSELKGDLDEKLPAFKIKSGAK